MIFNQTIKQLLVKLLVATAAIVIAIALFRWLLLPAVQWLFQFGEQTIAIIRRAGIFVSVVLAYWAYVRFYERRQANELRIAPVAIAIGAISGAAVIALISLVLFAFGVYEIKSYQGLDHALLGVAGVILVAATIEEIVFRGVLFLALEKTWGTVPALWLQSLIFSVLHIANMDPQMGVPELVMTVISGTLLGAFWTLIFIQTRNIWVVTANHAAWNFTIVLTGLPLSGLGDWTAVAPIVSTYQGPNWLSGGVVGPEDSIVTVLVVIGIMLGLVVWAKKTNKFVKQASGS
ncbi:MAG: CPBP family intramembrane metalloprotease [Gammaproteobacteria bacterium]|nr:CPBP family intramembrane metalloprotease [Gammaproteobacteria bacterium]MBU2059940.1 CPBP family intramembrane metalloprotease [Gammaproteobacteria bacterium]MBU2175805.1 CPBP family intramembrane metalloprotease [Gammaproteobacteria bacterium]MBU2247628.1 CPBP family intramembrane metalloprotease [Gammaproteobacteria bacterium]MBU2342943.1 CPBP family intramembrane metalloprotease [Gammaproteobacteria bacterium]